MTFSCRCPARCRDEGTVAWSWHLSSSRWGRVPRIVTSRLFRWLLPTRSAGRSGWTRHPGGRSSPFPAPAPRNSSEERQDVTCSGVAARGWRSLRLEQLWFPSRRAPENPLTHSLPVCGLTHGLTKIFPSSSGPLATCHVGPRCLSSATSFDVSGALVARAPGAADGPGSWPSIHFPGFLLCSWSFPFVVVRGHAFHSSGLFICLFVFLY